jgi:creatine kinase
MDPKATRTYLEKHQINKMLTEAVNKMLREQSTDPVAFLSEYFTAMAGPTGGDPKDTAEFKYLTYTECPKWTPDHKSLMSKTVTPELFAKLKDIKSDKGYTFSNAIMTGVETPHLGVGCTAGDEDSWEVFKDLYYPVIKGWHKYDPETQTHKQDLDASKLVCTDEQQAQLNKYVASTRVRAARNISGYGLPAGTSAEDRAAVETVLKGAFEKFDGDLKGTYYPLGGMADDIRDGLLKEGFLFQVPSAKNLLTMAGAARNWPDNRGIFHNDAKTALCWCNEEDQCRIISMSKDGNIKDVFARFAKISDSLKAAAEADGKTFMFNEKLGFLGTCPSNLGTGLRAGVMVTLTEFNKDPMFLDECCSKFDLQPRGSNGEHSEAIGGKFDVSNKQRIGFTEVELVQKMIDGVSEVIKLEEMLAAGKTKDEVKAAAAK